MTSFFETLFLAFLIVGRQNKWHLWNAETELNKIGMFLKENFEARHNFRHYCCFRQYVSSRIRHAWLHICRYRISSFNLHPDGRDAKWSPPPLISRQLKTKADIATKICILLADQLHKPWKNRGPDWSAVNYVRVTSCSTELHKKTYSGIVVTGLATIFEDRSDRLSPKDAY